MTGTFRDREDAARAVERLAAESVPPDAVQVWELTDDGEPRRSIPVRDDAGTGSGAIAGAIAGASVGLVVVLLGLLGVFGLEDADAWPTRVLWAVAIVGASAAAGVPIGAALGLGRWRGSKRLREAPAGRGPVQVRVDGEQSADVARRILQEAGAERVTP